MRNYYHLLVETPVAQYQQETRPEILREVSRAHKRSLAKPLVEYQALFSNRDEAMRQAYSSGAYAMAEIGQHFGVHYMTVSRAAKKFESK